MYADGHGVPQDNAESVRWYRKAADQGDADAQYNLGAMYANGQGIPQDYAEAMRWCRKAADQGNSSAQYHLGVMYAYGQGVPRDFVRAHIWTNLAAAQGDEEAAKIRDMVAQRMTSSQIATAQLLTRKWKLRK
jgi:hypothetical protein